MEVKDLKPELIWKCFGMKYYLWFLQIIKHIL